MHVYFIEYTLLILSLELEFEIVIIGTEFRIHFEGFGLGFHFERSILPFEFAPGKQQSFASFFILDLLRLDGHLRSGEEKASTKHKLNPKFMSIAMGAINPEKEK